MMGFSYEKRALKRTRLGPPDVYPQQCKQKEDELNGFSVSKGFLYSPQLPTTDEFGSAHDKDVSASKLGAFFNAIVLEKERANTLQLDTGKKRQQINTKENFWPATPRSKNAVEMWFKDLAASKPLNLLSKKAPNFNKKEEMFSYLCDYQVPVLRATWFIKLSSAFTVAVSEQKIKKRQLPDPTQEWTSTLLRFMKEQLFKLQDYYQNQNQSSNASSTPTPGGPTPADEQKIAMKQWQYCALLAKHMYQEGLLERQEVLQWILDLLERLKLSNVEDGLLRLFLSLTLQYLHEFVQSEQLSRRLVNLCARKLSNLVTVAINQQMQQQQQQQCENNDSNQPPTPQTPSPCPTSNQQNNSSSTNVAQININDPATILNEYLKCSHHRDMVISLSTIIQVVTLECPTALVWNTVGEGKSFSILNGSPLDHLPCTSANLPMPQRSATLQIRQQLRLGEELIRQRSNAAMNRWSSDKWRQSSAGIKMQKILNTLDALDRHSFERVDQNNSIDTLYNNIFPPITEKPASNPLNPSSSMKFGHKSNLNPSSNNDDKKEYDVWQDEAIVHILCEWAISHLRTGEHRAIAVARLLEKRQTEILNPGSFSAPGDNDISDDKDSVTSVPVPFPIFQPILMKYLDHHAPVLDNSAGSEVRFMNLVHMFSQLIRHDMFSHDAYMCTLISRGDLNSSNGASNENNTPHNNNNRSIDTPATAGPSSTHMHLDDDNGIYDIKPNINGRAMDLDDSKIDDDLDKLLQHIKQEQQNSMDGPDSPKEPGSFVTNSFPAMNNHDTKDNNNLYKCQSSRHVLYATHFPLPLDDECSSHDCNQRYVLLFGVGKQRDDARHTVKRISKDICKLFSKKFCIDVAEGGKVKKHLRNEFNFEVITSKVQALSYFDQHLVTFQCSATLFEVINNFATGNSSYLPVQEHVAFLFDLMELSLNVDRLIDLCIMILMEIPEVENQLMSRGFSLVKVYSSSLILYILGVLRRYHSCLLMSQEQTVAVFEGLYRIVKNIPNPGECTSVERCIFSHLYDLYTSASPLLKALSFGHDSFANTYVRIHQTIYSAVSSTPSNHGPWDVTFMDEAIKTYRRGGRIDPTWIRLLNESPVNRYSLVCNVIIILCSKPTTTDVDKLNDLGIFCAELTAACNALTAEWLGVLKALCCSSNHPSYFGDVLSRVDLQESSIHNSLAIFTAILVARNCIGLEDFVVHVALPSLVIVCNDGRRDADADAEAGARLTCHLLLRLFKTNEIPQPGLYSVGTSPHPMMSPNSGMWCIKQSCDRHLLAAMHNNVRVEALIAVLKAVIAVGDATAVRPGVPLKKSPSGHQTPNHSGKMSGELSISHILGTTDFSGSSTDNILLDLNSETTAPSLSEFAQYVLREICNQEWVLDRCLQNPEMLCRPDMLLDQMLTPKQAQRLLHMICYPEIAASTDNCLDHKTIINNIIQKLDQWTLRMSCLDMQLMFKQFKENSLELNQWLDMVAKAAINVFQLNKEESKAKPESIWLVAPLISKLPNAVQGRVLKVAGQVLENINVSGNTGSGSSNPTGTGGSSSRSSSKGTPQHQHQHMLQQQKSPAASPAPLIHHQPFLSLVLTCLKEQDDQREALLASLHSQLSQFLALSKTERINGGSDDFCGRSEDGLLLRFSLVGGMFDTIQKNTSLTTDWAVLLVQLITYGVIDNSNNSDLFSTVIDMLATLIHSTLVSDSQSEKGEENRRHYQNLMKKLKKEVGDKKSLSVAQVRQLLPLPKVQCEVIACAPIGCITDTKGYKITGFDSLDKKHGLHVTEKQKVSAWDILEGHKNPAPLSLSWFGAVRIERKPLWYEENHRLLKYHTHSLVKPSSYFLEPLPLPPEDMEPPMEKPMKGGPSGAPDTPTSVEQSPRGLKRSLKQGPANQRRKKQPTKPITPAGPLPPGMHPQVQGAPVPNQHMNYPSGGPPLGPQGQGNGNMYPCPPGQGNAAAPWGGYPQQGGHMGQQSAPPYYAQHQMPPNVSNGPPGARFERPLTQSKQALSNMLRARLPNSQYVGMQQQGGMPGHSFQGMPQRQQFMRQMRPPHNMQPPIQQSGPGPMFSNNGPGPGQQQQMFTNMPQGMNQNYSGYGNQQQQQQQQQSQLIAAAVQQQQQQQQQQMVGNPQSSMYQQQQQQHMQQQQAGGAGASFGMRQQEFQQQRMRSNAYMQAPNVTMNSMANQPPAPPYSRPSAPQSQVPVGNQQYPQQMQQQQRMRLLLMQQQQQQQHQQQQHQQQQQQQMAQIRQLHNSAQQQQNPYPMQPPPY